MANERPLKHISDDLLVIARNNILRYCLDQYHHFAKRQDVLAEWELRGRPVRNSDERIIELTKMSPRLVLSWHKRLRWSDEGYVSHGNKIYFEAEIRKALAKLPHVPNKREARGLRMKAKKMGVPFHRPKKGK